MDIMTREAASEGRPTQEEAEAAVRVLLRWAGDNPEREGLRDTPARVARSYHELFAGYDTDPVALLERTFEEVEGYDEIVLLRDIRLESYCEHHMVPIIGRAHVAYLPAKRVVGISKLARVVDAYAKRLQIQEKLTVQIANTINDVLQPRGVAVVIEAGHQCMSTRGVHKPGVSMVTSRMLGAFRDNPDTRRELLSMITPRAPSPFEGCTKLTMKLYGMKMSGNCWKVAQILRLTGNAFEWVETDSNAGATRTPEFLAINPNGKVPTLVLDDGAVLVESNAILLHFAYDTVWLPPPGMARHRVHEWLFFEQYSHEPSIAVARNLITWRREAALHPERLADCATRGAQALDVMERRLSAQEWLVGQSPTVADLALFAYTHRADEAGFDLARWPGVAAWVARLSARPGITTLPRPDTISG